MAPISTIKKRAIRQKPTAPSRHKPHGPNKNQTVKHRTTQKPIRDVKRERLTLFDWMLVLAFVDDHPDWDQTAIVEHFANRREGVLKFLQSALSRKLKPATRRDLEAQVAANPTALSRKRIRVVTRPDVDEALHLWQQDMERKGETVSGPMLIEKRKRFEIALNVPEEERQY
jgi:hypothetical protein